MASSTGWCRGLVIERLPDGCSHVILLVFFSADANDCFVKGILAIPALLLVAGTAYLLYESRLEHDRVADQLATVRAENEALQKRLEEVSKAAISEDELNRLQRQQAEALKLRAEVTKLKQELSEAKRAAAAAAAMRGGSSAETNKAPALLKVDPLPEDNPEVAVHKTEVMQTRMAPNSAILAGGWQGESGRRIFVLIRPTLMNSRGEPISNNKSAGEENAPNMITVESNWLEVSDETARKMRLSEIDGSGAQMAMLADFSMKQFKDEIDKAENIDWLSAPNVTTLAGRQARISVTESRDTSAGPVEFGPKVDVLPSLAEDGSTLEVGFRAAIVEARKR